MTSSSSLWEKLSLVQSSPRDVLIHRGFDETGQEGPGRYLTDFEWEELDDGWLEQALHETAGRRRGVRGPLAPIRARPAPGVPAGPGDDSARSWPTTSTLFVDAFTPSSSTPSRPSHRRWVPTCARAAKADRQMPAGPASDHYQADGVLRPGGLLPARHSGAGTCGGGPARSMSKTSPLNPYSPTDTW
jgi:hypothetical protein